MVSQNQSRRTLVFLASLVILARLVQSPATAQYAITNLVSNQAGKAKHQDKALVNAWGMSFFPRGPFWISDNGTGVTTFYDRQGREGGASHRPSDLQHSAGLRHGAGRQRHKGFRSVTRRKLRTCNIHFLHL